jgi:hypothetical protein
VSRPPLFETAEEFKAVADAYFAECHLKEQTPTVNGLSLALDMTRETLLRYEEKPGFSDTVKKVRTRLEAAWESRLAGSNCTGAIFWLKNQGWSDKTAVEHSGPEGGPIKQEVTRVEYLIVDPADPDRSGI